MSTAIEFENISKQYRLGLVSTRTLSHDLNRWWKMNIMRQEDPYLKIGSVNDRAAKADSEYVWALNDINFKVEQGDVVGIIGKNGAGKSTLLKILSKVTTPTTGTIRAKGRIASLLEVGTGFHPEMTGRENIFMNGAIMGMTKAEIFRKFDAIVDFAGVERYIDTPVKRYSSGMMVRLGFAVAAFLEPEILVVDEVLAVGDAEFQKKAIGKMQDVSKGEGRTVLFVSHNMESLQQLCNSGVLLENGRMALEGNISKVISAYLKDSLNQSEFIGGEGVKNEIYFENARVYSPDNSIIYNTSEIIVEMVVTVSKKIGSLVIGWNLFSSYHYPLARADYNDENQLNTLENGTYKFIFRIPAYTLADGIYTIHFDIAERNLKRYTSNNSVLTFTVNLDPDKRFGNVFSESSPEKSSIVKGNWLVKTERVGN